MSEPELMISGGGTQEWRLNGLFHREDGPAIIYTNGFKEWHLHGVCHREDDPAVIDENGKVQWWLNDHYYAFEEWCEELNKTDEEITLLKLEYM